MFLTVLYKKLLDHYNGIPQHCIDGAILHYNISHINNSVKAVYSWIPLVSCFNIQKHWILKRIENDMHVKYKFDFIVASGSKMIAMGLSLFYEISEISRMTETKYESMHTYYKAWYTPPA